MRMNAGKLNEKSELLVLGDFHAATREKTRELKKKTLAVIKQENPSHVACTGDFDHPSMALAWKKIEDELKKIGKTVATVPGNHDHANLKGLKITSKTLYEQKLEDNSTLQKEFEKNVEASEYVDSLLKSKVRVIRFEKTRFMVAHGALDGSLESYPFAPLELRVLWFRLDSSLDHRANFEKLVKTNCRVLLRGHDHAPQHASFNPANAWQSIKINAPDIESKTFEMDFKMDKCAFHTVTAGAFYDGCYAIITPMRGGFKVTFKKIK